MLKKRIIKVSIWDLIEFFLVETLKILKSLFYNNNNKLLSKNLKKYFYLYKIY